MRKNALEITLEERIRDRTFSDIANAMPTIVWTADPDGYTDYFNRHWYKYTGLTAEQSIGWAWGGTIHPDDLANCLQRWSNAWEKGETYEIEYRLKSADGTFRWFKGIGLPVRDTSGNITKWFGICTDIEEQKQAVLSLEARYATIIGSLQQRIVELEGKLANSNPDARILEMNFEESA